ncbi:MAG: hypothetical protein ACOC6S_02435 [Chloroflexota bacterium]
MILEANCKTTAMGIMPHTDVERALDLALSLDIPFWPQLPKVSFYEDMYAQVSEGFPGVRIDVEGEKVDFSHRDFEEDLERYSRHIEDPATFELSQDYSVVFHKFFEGDLKRYPAIRGQTTGPVSYGFKIVDENLKPIIYNEEIRALLFDFIQRKLNAQYQTLVKKNRNAFVWLDEPGLGWVFNSLSGYNDVEAKEDYRSFLSGVESPKALHLCADVNLPYLLELGLDLLSFDAYQMEIMPRAYTDDVGRFIESDGIVSWGLVPTDSSTLGQETPETLTNLLLNYWGVIAENSGVPLERIARQALIAPARCCLKNIGAVGADDDFTGNVACSCNISSVEEKVVERAFAYVKQVSEILREKFNL